MFDVLAVFMNLQLSSGFIFFMILDFITYLTSFQNKNAFTINYHEIAYETEKTGELTSAQIIDIV